MPDKTLRGFEQKDWGWTRCVCKRKKYSLHELKLTAGGFCSFHYHTHRSNLFSVQSGLVRVVWAFGWELHHADLKSGDTLEIEAKVPHQFQVLESGDMVEEYFSQDVCEDADIHRLTTGGLRSAGILKDPVGIIGTHRMWIGWQDD